MTGQNTASRAGEEKSSGYAAGLIWSSINAGAGVALPFVIFVFFARHLSPADFGCVVFATVLAEALRSFGLPGLYEALLQRTGDTRIYHETASAVLLFAGVALFGVFLLVCRLLGQWIPNIAMAPGVTAMIGLRIVFDLAGTQPLASLAQELRYRRMATRSVFANTCAGSIGAFLALHGDPLTGFAAYLLGQSVFVCLFTTFGTGALAQPRFSWGAFRLMLPEAYAASIVRLVATVNNSVDQIVIAASISPLSLAYFNLGKRMEAIFITVSSSFSSILFQPVFSRQAPAARAASLRRGLAVLGLVCGLPAVIFIANTKLILVLAFGPRWEPAAQVAAILAGCGLVRAFCAIHGALLSVTNRNRQLMAITVVSASGGLLTVLLAAPFGLAAVAGGLLVKNIGILGWMAASTRETITNPARTYARRIGLPCLFILAASNLGGSLGRIEFTGQGVLTQLGVVATSALAALIAALMCFLPAIFPSRLTLMRLKWRPILNA